MTLSNTRQPGHALTHRLAEFALTDSANVPAEVRGEAVRAFTNWLGCVLGGCREEAAMRTGAAMVNAGAEPCAAMIGQGRTSDPESAAFVNCVSSSALAFDDTHLATVTHPTGPVAAAAFALAQTRPIHGIALAEAIAMGIEIQCRLSNALLMPPAQANLALYITGVTGAVGTAAAVGRLEGLDGAQMVSALGLAAAMASGFRATHGSMAGSIVPSFAVRSGMLGVRLAAEGVTCSAHALEGPSGFLDIFAVDADPAIALAGLGDDYELFSNAYKPYPCGIVIHPVIDASLDARDAGIDPAAIEGIVLRVNPLAKSLADRPAPKSLFDVQVSLQHWTAVALTRGAAGIAECNVAASGDAISTRLRQCIVLETVAEFARDEAALCVTMRDGTQSVHHVRHARGSIERPMTDEELDRKFMAQALPRLGEGQSARLLAACGDLLRVADAGSAIGDLIARI